MKKISRRSFLTAMAAVSAAGVLAACGASSSTASSVAASSEATTSSEAVPESVTIKAFNGAKELVDVEVPFDPQRIAILELASLDILDELGVGDRVVGTASTSLDYLQSYVTNDSIVNLGNIKEAKVHNAVIGDSIVKQSWLASRTSSLSVDACPNPMMLCARLHPLFSLRPTPKRALWKAPVKTP